MDLVTKVKLKIKMNKGKIINKLVICADITVQDKDEKMLCTILLHSKENKKLHEVDFR